MQPKEKLHTPPRNTYRHGDLRRTLIEAGVALARAAGPEAVVLREVTRQAGVVPNAAYRHFANRDDLLAAVREAALVEVARAIEAEIARVDPAAAPAARALARFRAVGIGYLGFAEAERGLFRTAFVVPPSARDLPPAEALGQTEPNPFTLLGAALDDMVATGVLPGERRPGAEFLAWSAVHGLATLLMDGPLAAMPEPKRRQVGRQLVAMVEKGL